MHARRSLYLHFLSGELREILDTRSLASQIEAAVRILALGTSAELYAAYSALWESDAISRSTLRFVRMLVDEGVVGLQGYTPGGAAFLETRTKLYRHDQDRYPTYFDERRKRELLAFPITLNTAASTTDALIAALGQWVAEPRARARSAHPAAAAVQAALARVIEHALIRRDSEAITYSFFAPFVEEAGLPAGICESLLRRLLFVEYSGHYMHTRGGDIPTGLPGMDELEATLMLDFPSSDVPLLRVILKSLGFGHIIDRPWAENSGFWEPFAALRGWGAHQRLTMTIDLLVRTAMDFVAMEPTDGPQSWLRDGAWKAIGGCFDPPNGPRPSDPVDLLEDSALQAERALRKAEKVAGLRLPLDFGITHSDRSADILLVTATKVETEAVLDTICHRAARRERVYLGESTFYRLGRHGGAEVVLVQCEAGSSGPSGSQAVTSDAIAIWRPSAVILVGIAFGVDKARQRLGDVLVSTQIQDYELVRMGTDDSGRPTMVLRGNRPPASPGLLDKFRAVEHEITDVELRFGLVLSGDKLIDNVDFRDQIVQLTGGEAIGGEMEGRGVFSTAYRRRLEWIVVKAISDWADGRKRTSDQRKRQQRAAWNAALVVRECLRRGGVGVSAKRSSGSG